MVKKNRREIASSGVANYIERIFAVGTSTTRAFVLLMIGNLLSSGLFHDKIARRDILSNFIDDLLDPGQPRQFVAVSFVLAQLTQVQSSAATMVECNVIQVTLPLLPRAPPEAAL